MTNTEDLKEILQDSVYLNIDVINCFIQGLYIERQRALEGTESIFHETIHDQYRDNVRYQVLMFLSRNKPHIAPDVIMEYVYSTFTKERIQELTDLVC